MSKYIFYVFLLSCFLLFANLSFAQINAEFSVNKTLGCSPFSVQFSDLSTPGSSIVFHKWYFGNGNSSTLANPQASYGEPGQYTVTLIVSDGSSFDTIVKTNLITVLDDPVPNFLNVTPNAGCNPLSVSFQDLSTGSNGSDIQYWNWDFGDGVTSDEVNPSHIFYLPGTYTVSLHVIDDNFCDNSFQIENFVSISETPIPDFTTSENKHCSAPFEVSFYNNSIGAGNLTYYWDFGDGNISTEVNPVNLYENLGIFELEFIAYDENGCSDTIIVSDQVQIVAVDADFTTVDSVYCIGEAVSFINTSVGANSFFWDFGDGDTISDETPTHAYDTAGVFTVTLNAFVDGDTCTNNIQKTIRIEDVVANYERDFYICQLPKEVQYTNTSINAVSWDWHFGLRLPYNAQNNIHSTEENPLGNYLETLKRPNIYEYLYSDTLIATSFYGCKDTLIVDSSIYINLPKVKILNSPSNGCVPLNVDFNDGTEYNSAYDNVISWHWDFGTGDTSNIQNSMYMYENHGDFDAILSIETEYGCQYTDSTIISAGIPVIADYSVSLDTSCAYNEVKFTDLTTDEQLVNEWFWSFDLLGIDAGVGLGGHHSSNQNPLIMFLDTGYVADTLIASYNGCADTLIRDSVTYIQGPVSYFYKSNNCSNPLDFSFRGTIIDADRWYWNFGDGTPIDSVSIEPTHTYSNSGYYTVSLTSYNEETGCYFADTQEVSAFKVLAAIAADTIVGCPGLEVSFDGGRLSENEDIFIYNGFFGRYLWNFGDGSLFYDNSLPNIIEEDSLIVHIFENKGTYRVSLIVEDVNRCRDTAYQTIKVYYPEPQFASDYTNGCAPMTVDFTNNTLTDTTIVSWLWDFGNGDTSIIENPSIIYNADSSFTVSLQAINILGCTNLIEEPSFIAVKKTIPKFLALDSVVCEFDTVFFTNQTIGDNLEFLWDFGDGNTSTEFSPMHYYQDTGYYQVSLTVTDTFACVSVLSDDSLILKQAMPPVNFFADTVSTDCYPLLVRFTDSTNYSYVNSWKWTFGDGASSTLQNPEHMYIKPGDYSVQLIAKTNNGCSDTIIKSNFIDVNGPYAEYSMLETFACKGQETYFVIDTIIDAVDFSWDFGDGNVVPSTGDTISHVYTDYGKFYPTLIFSDSANACPQFYSDSLIVNLVIANFTWEDTLVCALNDFEFQNVSFGDVAWNWDFGDNGNSSLQNPVHQFPAAGTYNVSLLVYDESLCKDSVEKVIVVSPTPIISTAFTDTLKCDGDTIILDAGAGYDSYSWSNSETTQTIEVFDSDTITYLVKNIEGCWSSFDTIVVREIPIPDVNLGNDTAFCEGTSISLDATGSVYDTYLWHNDSTYAVFTTDSVGLFFVKVSNICGESIDSIDVSMTMLPQIDLGTDTTICNGESLFLDAGSNYEYLWHNDSTYQVFEADTVGLFYVKISNECGIANDSINIDIIRIPEINLGSDTTICEGTTISFTATNSIYDSYLWQNGSTDSIITTDSIGIYSVTVSNRCFEMSDTVEVFMTMLPQIDLGIDTAICYGDSLILDAGIDYSYLWQNGSVNQIFIVDTVGLFSVKVSNECGLANDSINIDIIRIPEVNLGLDTTICEGTTISFTATNSIYDSYLWQNGSTDSILTTDSIGIYSVAVSNRCFESSDTVEVFMTMLPQIDLGIDTAICYGDSLILDAGIDYSYLWQDGSVNQTYIVDAIGEFYVKVENGCGFSLDTINVDIIPIPQVSLGLNDTICEGDSIVFDIIGSSYDSYLWQDGSIDSIYVIDTLGIYYAEVSNRCFYARDTVEISMTYLPEVSLRLDTTICEGRSILLDAGAGYNYLWQDSIENQTIVVDTMGLYYVEVSNNCGFARDTFELGIIPFPEIDLGIDTTICEGSFITLDAGAGFTYYIWNVDSITQTISVDDVGTYGLIAMNVCGTKSDSINIDISEIPVIDLGIDTTICEDADLILDAGSGYAEYLWHDSSSNQTFEFIEADTIYASVKNDFGCWSEKDTIIISTDSHFEINLGEDTTICDGENIVLDAGEGYATYFWQDSLETQTITIFEQGDYSVTVTNTCNVSTDTFTLSIISTSVSIGNDTILCDGDTLILNAGSGISYLWQDNSTDSIYIVTTAGQYYVSVTNICVAKSDTVEINYLPSSLKLANDTIVCEDETVTIYAPDVGYDLHYWEDLSQADSLIIFDAGVYYLTASNQCGTFKDSVVISHIPLPIVDLGDDFAISFGSEVLDAGMDFDSYFWSTGDTNQYIAVSAGNYDVWVVVQKDGCYNSDTISILSFPENSSCMADVPTAFSPNGDGLNDVLYIRGYCIDEVVFMVFNRYGETMFATTNIDEGWDGTYKGVLQPTEVYVYYLKVKFEDGHEMEKTSNVTIVN